jgi:integrase
MTWYEATRHTFASQWVLEGKPIGRLARMMGHSETEVTERYAHLRVDLFPAEDRQALAIDMDGDTVPNGYKTYR